MSLGSWNIDDWITFACNTHNPTTGAAQDADSVPTYRLYEDETSTPLLTGSMAKLDDANTTGFYTERVQLTAAAGFEAGKAYTIYIQATVDSVTATKHETFQIRAAVDAAAISGSTTAADSVESNIGNLDDAITDVMNRIGAPVAASISADLAVIDAVVDAIKAKTDSISDNAVAFVSPVNTAGDIEVYAGDDHTGDNAIEVPVSGWSGHNVDGAESVMRVMRKSTFDRQTDAEAVAEYSVTVAQSGSDVTVTISLSASDTEDLLTSPPKDEENYQYQVISTVATGKEVTVASAQLTIKKRMSTPS